MITHFHQQDALLGRQNVEKPNVQVGGGRMMVNHTPREVKDIDWLRAIGLHSQLPLVAAKRIALRLRLMGNGIDTHGEVLYEVVEVAPLA